MTITNTTSEFGNTVLNISGQDASDFIKRMLIEKEEDLRHQRWLEKTGQDRGDSMDGTKTAKELKDDHEYIQHMNRLMSFTK